jgi:hypothetical protein
MGVLCSSRFKALLVCALLMGGALNAHAVAYSCIGKVDQVTVDPNGNVNATFTFQTGSMPWMQACNLGADSLGVSPAACRGVLTVLLTARTSNQSVQMWFDNATPGQCTFSGWQALKTLGWYWGPSIAS